MNLKFLIIGLMAITLVATQGCGGGSSESHAASAPSSSTSTTPVAGAFVFNGGPSTTVRVRETVWLDGRPSRAANGNPLSFSWTLTSAPPGSKATISDDKTALPGIKIDFVGTYKVSLVVSDGKTVSNPSNVTITAIGLDITKIPEWEQYSCLKSTREDAQLKYREGHTYLDRDNDGKPCELSDVYIESPPIQADGIKPIAPGALDGKWACRWDVFHMPYGETYAYDATATYVHQISGVNVYFPSFTNPKVLHDGFVELVFNREIFKNDNDKVIWKDTMQKYAPMLNMEFSRISSRPKNGVASFHAGSIYSPVFGGATFSLNRDDTLRIISYGLHAPNPEYGEPMNAAGHQTPDIQTCKRI